jgi:hypothetical protein
MTLTPPARPTKCSATCSRCTFPRTPPHSRKSRGTPSSPSRCVCRYCYVRETPPPALRVLGHHIYLYSSGPFSESGPSVIPQSTVTPAKMACQSYGSPRLQIPNREYPPNPAFSLAGFTDGPNQNPFKCAVSRLGLPRSSFQALK